MVRMYIISVKTAAPWSSLTLLSFHSLCLHLCSHLTKWEVFSEYVFVTLSNCQLSNECGCLGKASLFVFVTLSIHATSV